MAYFTNNWTLVTGASSGIGRACAVAFAREGSNLILLARRLERLEQLRDELVNEYGVQVLVFSADVRDKNQMITVANRLIEQDIVPDVLINNAGLALGKEKIQEGLYSDWDTMIDTNVKGLLYATRTFLPMMVEKNKGYVLNVGSSASFQVYPNGNVYNATKFAVRALTEAINLDLVDTDIRCGSIDPAATETEFSLVRFKGDEERATEVYEGYEALHAEDIAEIAVFMVSRPKHVNIRSVLVYPTNQRNAYVHRKG